MNERQRLADDIRSSFDGDPWHGPSTKSLLLDLTAAEAFAKPLPGAHGPWELVLHMTAWTREVARRLEGHPPGTPKEGDWPFLLDDRDVAWQKAIEGLGMALAALAAAVETFPEARLREQVGGSRDAPLGTGVTYADMLSGLAQHQAYHSGQIALLRKALGK